MIKKHQLFGKNATTSSDKNKYLGMQSISSNSTATTTPKELTMILIDNIAQGGNEKLSFHKSNIYLFRWGTDKGRFRSQGVN